VKPPVRVADPAEVVTTTFCTPTLPVGVTAVIEVALTTTMLVAEFPPILTVAPVIKPVPVIVIGVPPEVNPVGGVTLVMVTGR
jgi:hypothetical protein